MDANLEPQWPEDDGSGSCGESRIDRVAASHGDGEHYDLQPGDGGPVTQSTAPGPVQDARP